MLAWLSNPLYKIGAIVLLCVLLMAGIHFYNKHQQGIGYSKAVAEYNVKKIQAIEAAQQKTNEWREKYESAENERSKLEHEINRLFTVNSGTVADIGRLRVTINNLRRGMPTATAETCAVTDETISELFGDCTARIERIARLYGEVASKADRHAADAEALSNAWPK